MKTISTLLFSALFLFLLTGCPNSGKFKYHNAWFSSKPQNLTHVNSEYDDYNSALPEVHFGKKLIFSSNRSSEGNDFDIYDGNFRAVWYMETGMLEVDNQPNTMIDYTFHSKELLEIVDKNGDQFGPYAIGFDSTINGHPNRVGFLAYSTTGGSYSFHSEFVYYTTPDEGATFELHGPDTIPFLGDPRRQQYISFYSPQIFSIDRWELNPDLFTEMYFDKIDDNNKSNIYRIDIPDTLNFIPFLSTDNEYVNAKVDVLSSEYNDRCPFVNGQFMVFTSDRPGGYGGYDLYYSTLENDQWSQPVNFGEDINTEFDEFRPVVVHVDEFKNDLMIFSSNRPGGLGGYDLYYVGIDKIEPIAIE